MLKIPPGFEHEKYSNYVFKLTKALCSLKQTPKAWYERLSSLFFMKWF